MIKLQSGAILLQAPGGELEFLDLDKLNEDLWACCREIGLDDPELPSDIANVISTFAQNSSDLNESDIDRLVVKILTDSGQHVLAEAFADLRNAPLGSLLDEQIVATEEVVDPILRNDPFFMAKPIAQLATMVVAQVEKLGFESCSRSLILELGRNTWLNLDSVPEPDPDNYWLLKRQDMLPLFEGEALRLFSADIISVHSISAFFPSVVMRVDLAGLAHSCGAQFFPEMKLFPAIDALCPELLSMRRDILSALAEQLTSLETRDVSTNIIFVGIDGIIRECYQGNKKREAGLRNELNQIIAPYLESHAIRWEMNG